MIILVLLVALGAAIVGGGGPRALGHDIGRRLARVAPGLWRPGVGMLAFVVLIVAFAAAVRGEWSLALGALVTFGVLATTTRYRSGLKSPDIASRHRLSLYEAATRLGVDVRASPVEIRAAHARLIRAAHPDRGGSPALAAELNAARDALLRRR